MSFPDSIQTVHVRPAALDDVGAMAGCHTRSIREAYKGFLSPADLAIFTETETAIRIAAQIESSDRVLVALIGNQVVGHARWGGRLVEEALLQVGSNSYLNAFFAFYDLPGLRARLS